MSEQLSLGKWADKWDVKATALKKIVKELEIEPTSKKGNCAYYSEEALAEVKKRADSK